ncbi:MAG: NAD-dependent epimerase/dehydratase family protein [Nitrospirae bacterium]|nr:NAD-dependent epimerase/dehydratase family protein [Nitrospirota bacterium]
MRILVTGGAGFIGSHIVDAYINEGHEVFVLDNLSTGKRENINPKAVFYHADIRDDLILLFKEINPDVINHHAAQIYVRASVEDPCFDAEVNIIGTINLVDAGLKSGIKKFILASSGAIYGEQEYYPADEAHPSVPLSPYGVAKLTCEKYLHYYKYNFGLDYTALRYSNVYGPRQNHLGESGVIAIFINKLLKDEQPVIHGDGSQMRDYVFVDDVVAANIKALEPNISGEFNISTGAETSVNELYDNIAVIIGKDITAYHGIEKKGDLKRSCLLYKKAKEILGWSPTVSLPDGLKNTVEWFSKKFYNGFHN